MAKKAKQPSKKSSKGTTKSGRSRDSKDPVKKHRGALKEITKSTIVKNVFQLHTTAAGGSGTGGSTGPQTLQIAPNNPNPIMGPAPNSGMPPPATATRTMGTSPRGSRPGAESLTRPPTSTAPRSTRTDPMDIDNAGTQTVFYPQPMQVDKPHIKVEPVKPKVSRPVPMDIDFNPGAWGPKNPHPRDTRRPHPEPKPKAPRFGPPTKPTWSGPTPMQVDFDPGTWGPRNPHRKEPAPKPKAPTFGPPTQPTWRGPAAPYGPKKRKEPDNNAWPYPDRNRQPNKMLAVEPPPIIVKKSGPRKRKGAPEGLQLLAGYRVDHPEKKRNRST